MLKNVNPELIENVKDLKIALNELTVYDLNVYSMSELYYKVAHKLNEVIKELSRFEGVLSDEVIKQNEKLIYLLGEGLETEVVKEIDNLINEGFFDRVLNVKIFNDLNNKIDNFKLEIDSKLDFKSDKNHVWSMVNIGQDIKEAMTGGSVAVVGENAITNINVIQESLQGYNMGFLERNSANLLNPHTVKKGYLIRLGDGSLEPHSEYSASDFIPVEPNTTYISNNETFRAEYDADKNFIKSINASSNTTTETTRYMRVTSPISKPLFFYKNGDGAENFDNYKLSNTISIDGDNIKNKSVNLNHVDFINRIQTLNLFDKDSITNGVYINNGNYVVNSIYCVTDYIPVEEGCTYVCSGTGGFLDVYNKNKAFIYFENTKTITIPTGGAYIRWTINIEQNDLNKIMICKDELPSKYVEYSKEYLLEGNVKVNTDSIIEFKDKVIDIVGLEKYKSYWSGKKWVAIGDSITEWSYDDENGVKVNWRDVVTGNIGFSSSKCCAYWGHKMGDIHEIMEYAGVTEEDISNADIITVSLGQNDRTTPIGTINDEPSFKQGSFYGDTKGLIEYLLSLNNKCTLAFITPTPSIGSETKLRELSNIIIEVCEKYSIPVLDLNKMSNFNKSNYEYFYFDGSVHPNGIGNKRMGRITTNFINQL